MWSRLQYMLRETWASLQRNVTLTVAAIITAAVSLLIFGLTLLLQSGFGNLLHRWQGDVQMIVYLNEDITPEARQGVQQTLDQQIGRGIESYKYCDQACTWEDVQLLFAGNPTTLNILAKKHDDGTLVTSFNIVPTDKSNVTALKDLRNTYLGVDGVNEIVLAEEQLDLIARLQSFVSTYTNGLWIALMGASGLLIWNTIRTAMFARRREIEVMKLVGATDWFIRIPFMLEGLIQGVLGALLADAALLFINHRWTLGVAEFPPNTGMQALVVVNGYQFTVALIILVFGALVGMVGAGIAATRFLDV